ncbi:uncharacterized protein LOC142589755 [Dermacentor variabilis]|uniref:uncharacterized protein LOC142589755 n=1 Tax=Dermacentor variabilis TaxID=34621 RepID=UPI003F5CA281
MTSIGEPFVLATVTNEADAFRDFCVQPGPSDSSVIVTHGQLSASLVELEGRPFKIRMWHTSHAEPFTCPVVYDALRSRYVAASHKSLLILPPQDASGDTEGTRERIAVPERVFSVLHRNGGEPLIVLDSGVCLTLTELQGSGKRSRSKKPRVCGEDEQLVAVRAEAAMETGRNGLATSLLSVSVAAKAAGPYRCRLFRVGEAAIEQISEASVSKSDRPPVCLFGGDLLSLGEDGSLCGRKLPLSSADEAAGAFLAALDDSRVLVGLPGRLLVWNARFGTLEVSRTLEQAAAKRWALLRNDVACFVVAGGAGNNNNNVMCVSVKLGRPTLCQVVGLGARAEGSVPAASAVAAKISAGDAGGVVEELAPVADTLPERDLVMLVERLFHTGTPPSAGSPEVAVLHSLLRCPHTCEILVQCLRDYLHSEQATALFVYLISVLETYSLADREEIPLEKVIDWLSCLLDAHFNHWALDTGPLAIGDLLRRLSVAVSHVQELFGDLCELEQWLMLILGRMDTLKFEDPSLYTIEILEI